MFPTTLDMKDAKKVQKKTSFFKNSAVDRMTHFNILSQ